MTYNSTSPRTINNVIHPHHDKNEQNYSSTVEIVHPTLSSRKSMKYYYVVHYIRTVSNRPKITEPSPRALIALISRENRPDPMHKMGVRKCMVVMLQWCIVIYWDELCFLLFLKSWEKLSYKKVAKNNFRLKWSTFIKVIMWFFSRYKAFL